MSNLSLVVCGAPLAARAQDVAEAIADAGWAVSLVVTSAATAWISGDESGFRRPDDPKPARPDAVVVCPMTFNTANKWALGIADTQPLSLLAESLGAGIPIVAVPFVNESLAGHPAWSTSLALLAGAGVRFLAPDPNEAEPLPSGTGVEVAERFDPQRILEALA